MYKIEITADTLAELTGKVTALAAKLNTAEAPRYVGPLTGEAEPEVAEAAPADPTPAPKSAPAAEVSDNQPTTPEPASTPAPAASASNELDFDADVAPYVLQVVKEKGKPVAQEILSQFGVEKASLLDPERWPELVEALRDAL